MQDYVYHIHTSLCPHVEKTVVDEETVQQFIEIGCKSIAFTDHTAWKTFDYVGTKATHALDWSKRQDYKDLVHGFQKKYKDKIEILLGWEMEYMPEYREEMDMMKEETQLLVIGQHFSPLGNGKYDLFHREGYIPAPEHVYNYVNAITNACKEGYATIIAHPDLFMLRKTTFDKDDAKAAEMLCEASLKYDVPLEINLCRFSLHDPAKDPIEYPRKEFWEIAADYHVKALYGLDYHGKAAISRYSEMIESANKIIGNSNIDRLHLCTREEIKTR